MANKSRKYGIWKEEDMERAIASFKNGDMGIIAVCRVYGVPKKTLKRRLAGTGIFGIFATSPMQKGGLSRISHLLNESFPKSAVVATAINGFRATGVSPINKDLFEDRDFADHTNMPVVIRNDAVTRDQPNDDVRPSTGKL
ncbi:hypothetical protein J6590_084399 [Homalodisca vitripennis]|nr:hypothetical protein J6590_084399 [Homalodisca vitripennis]